jgi:hypothetical protein
MSTTPTPRETEKKMAWNLINPLAITTRRRVIASAVLYGLSLSIRFTSAAGEEVEIPALSVQRTSPVISIMTGNRAQLPYQDWSPKSAHPIVFRHGWQPGCAAP